MENWPLLQDESEDEKVQSDAYTILKEAKGLMSTATPIALANLCEFGPSFLALVMVGHSLTKLSETDEPMLDELNALGIGRMYFNVTCLSIGLGFVSALNTLAPQAVGAKTDRQLHRTHFQMAIISTLILSFPCYVLLFMAEPILVLIGQDPTIAHMAGRYCSLIVPGYLLTIFFFAMQRLGQSLDWVWELFLCCVSGLLASVVVLLVFVTWFQWSYVGAAIAFDTYTSVPTLMLLWFFYRGRRLNIYSFVGFGKTEGLGRGDAPKITIHRLTEYLRLAFPAIFQACLEWWYVESVTLACGVLPNPKITTGASLVLSYLQTLLIMIWLGFQNASTVHIGIFIGSAGSARTQSKRQHNVYMAKRTSFITCCLAVILATVIAGYLLLFPEAIVSLVTRDTKVIELGGQLIPILAAIQPLDAATQALGGTLRALGKQKVGAYAQIIGYYAVGGPFAYLFAFHVYPESGVFWLWGSLCVSMVVNFTIQLVYLIWFDWDIAAQEAQERNYIVTPEAPSQSYSNP